MRKWLLAFCLFAAFSFQSAYAAQKSDIKIEKKIEDVLTPSGKAKNKISYDVYWEIGIGALIIIGAMSIKKSK